MEYQVISICMLAYLISVVTCAIQSETFTFNSVASGKTCPLPDQLFTLTVSKKIACVKDCMKLPNCKGVAYTPTNGLCTGCSGYYDIFSTMVDAPSSLFYAVPTNIDNCGIPIVADIHVVLDVFSGNSSVGAQLAYTCTPCTYFPLMDNPVITCQANLTWTIPECVFGPDVGHLANNEPIAVGETGCGEYYGNSCEGSGLSGDLLKYNGLRGDCFCDNECCSSEDCCFDSTCSDTPPIF
ncbi:uncharacterized protein LOC132745557 [Ruditapes philippinarum]|uniref:uncharacterized protein LOC132745557 n=1 Tax=Ruditapes philippinarum TaxID=129788 RepID=UPI00295C2ADC|nr:uncharacterized protein LOC132745557 [Ruditapes philippinarum]